MRRFYVDNETLSSGRTVLTGSDAKHLRTVLRVQSGDEIFLFDQSGWEYSARIAGVSSRTIEVTVVTRQRSAAESPAVIAIGQAMLKGRKMGRIVRQLTELGVTAFFPFLAERSVSRPDLKRLSARRSRWETIATESLKQCGRYRATDIRSPLPFKTFLDGISSYDCKLIFHGDANNTTPLSELFSQKPVQSVIALVGPEGGFSTEEMGVAEKSGFFPVHFGPRILKADTAAIAVATVLQHLVGDLKG